MRGHGPGGMTAVPRVEGLLLDKDGPIVPLHPTWSKWAVQVLDALADRAPREALADALAVDARTGVLDPDGLLAVGTGAAVEASLVSIVVGHGGMSAAGGRASVRLALRAADRRARAEPLVGADGVRDLLLHCRSHAVPVAVVTNDARTATRTQLKALGLADLVAVTVCGDDGHDPKPAGAMLRAACAALGVDPSASLMAGDTLVDRLAAEEADVPFVAVRERRPSWAPTSVPFVRRTVDLTGIVTPGTPREARDG